MRHFSQVRAPRREGARAPPATSTSIWPSALSCNPDGKPSWSVNPERAGGRTPGRVRPTRPTPPVLQGHAPRAPSHLRHRVTATETQKGELQLIAATTIRNHSRNASCPYKNPDPARLRAHIADTAIPQTTLEEKSPDMQARRPRWRPRRAHRESTRRLHACTTHPRWTCRRGENREHTRPVSATHSSSATLHPRLLFWPGARSFPSPPTRLALSWDPRRRRSAGRATAEEVTSTRRHWTFSPVLCIARRQPRQGSRGTRPSRDPMLIGGMATAMVKGYQGGVPGGERLPKGTRDPRLRQALSPDTPRPRAA